jgi:LysM repeat protein
MDAAGPAAAASAAAAAAADAPDDEQQLAAFEAAPAEPVVSAPASLTASAVAAADEPPLGPSSTPATGTPADDVDRGFDPAPLPTFLNARSPRARSGSATQPVGTPSASPTWESDPRRAAQQRSERNGDGTFSRLLTLVAVVIILALGVATVLIVPGLLSGAPGQTTRPSLVAAASRLPSPLGSGVAVLPSQSGAGSSVAPASSTPVPEATPTPTPRSYKVQPGDSLRRIARQFGVTPAAILAANPTIPDADHIQVGQRLVIPAP